VTAYSPEAWETFFLGNAGAAAALAGLVFVGVSINVDQIVASRRLTGRALEAFALLGSVLVYSVLVLVPDITRTGLGVALAVVGVVIWGIVVSSERSSLPFLGGERDPEAPPGSTTAAFALSQAATVPVLVAAVTLLAEGGGGLYWLVAAVIFSYIAALANAWVLVIEIRR
jgi:hypothetical protein